jgi:hypothetical protein
MVARLKTGLQESHESEVPLYPGYISGYERGLREPPLVVLLQHARLAAVPLENLVDDNLDLPGYYLRYMLGATRRYQVRMRFQVQRQNSMNRSYRTRDSWCYWNAFNSRQAPA